MFGGYIVFPSDKVLKYFNKYLGDHIVSFESDKENYLRAFVVLDKDGNMMLRYFSLKFEKKIQIKKS